MKKKLNRMTLNELEAILFKLIETKQATSKYAQDVRGEIARLVSK